MAKKKRAEEKPMEEPRYKRVLLKISGEALAGERHFGLDFDVIGRAVSYTHLTLPTICSV